MRTPEAILRSVAAPLLDATRVYRWSRRTERYNFTDQPRKEPAQIRADLRAWRASYGAYDFSYFEFGADIEGRGIRRYMPYSIFRQYRNASNRQLAHSEDFTYECLLEDKAVFERYARACGHATPVIYAVVTPAGFFLADEHRIRKAEDFPDAFPDTAGILKPAVGIRGADISMVQVDGGSVRVNGAPTDWVAFCRSLRTRYVFQALVRQHEALAALNPSSVNTLRLVTVREEDGARPLSAVLKMGRRGGHVDNLIRGGVAVLVDLDRAALRGHGVFSKGQPQTEAHPDSGVRLDGYELPHLDACVQAACALHDDLYGFHSVGWDIAITEAGPVIIEGNSNWSGAFHLTLDPSFTERYLDSLGSLPPRPYRHRHARLVD